MSELQDNDIIQQILSGNTNAYSILVDRYQHFVFTIALKYIPNREQAEEIAQDVFIKAYRSLAGFKGGSKFSTWLYTIVHTCCLSTLRKKSFTTYSIDDNLGNTVSAFHASDKLESTNRKQLINKAINQLEPADSEIITLYYLAEQSVEEIAIIMQLSSANVKVRLFRARQRLKEILLTHQVRQAADL